MLPAAAVHGRRAVAPSLVSPCCRTCASVGPSLVVVIGSHCSRFNESCQKSILLNATAFSCLVPTWQNSFPIICDITIQSFGPACLSPMAILLDDLRKVFLHNAHPGRPFFNLATLQVNPSKKVRKMRKLEGPLKPKSCLLLLLLLLRPPPRSL